MEVLDLELKKREVDQYLKKYKNEMEVLEHKSLLAKALKGQGGVNEGHIHALGKRLQLTEQFKNHLLHEYGTQADLGLLPTHAGAVISVNFNNDPMNILAGSQEMPTTTALLFYKKVMARTTRGNVTSGQMLRDPKQAPEVYANDFSDDNASDQIATTTAGTLTYSFTLTKNPIRRGTVRVTLSSGTNFATDQGQAGVPDTGLLLGIGISGTINYLTGNITVNFATDPGNGIIVSAFYATNFEENGSYPRINPLWDNKIVNARVWTIGSEIGVIESFQLKKVLGVDADEDMIKTLSDEMMAEQTQKLTRQMYGQAPQTFSWVRTVPSGVSDYLHIKGLHQVITRASGGISKQAGRGLGNILVGDVDFCSYLEATNDDSFELIGVPSSGVHIRGIYKKTIPVICDPSLAINPATGLAYTDNIYRGYMTYKGTNNYDIAAVYGTFLPFFTAGNVPVLNNLLKKQGIAGAVGALENLVPNFTVRIHITP